jgi:hypothetical protein
MCGRYRLSQGLGDSKLDVDHGLIIGLKNLLIAIVSLAGVRVDYRFAV